MSWQAVTWVLEHSQAIHSSRLVLLSIASHANREGRESWPSVETMCIEARLSRRIVQYCLRELEEIGELRTIPRIDTSNSYELPLVNAWLAAQSLRTPPAQSKTSRERKLTQKGALTAAPEPFLNHPKEEPSSEKPQEKPVLCNVGERSKTTSDLEGQAEVDRLIQGRAIKKVARKMSFPKRRTIEDQKAELRLKGWLQ